jgi:hypothetical protein
MQIVTFSKRIALVHVIGDSQQHIICNAGERLIFQDSTSHQLRSEMRPDGTVNEVSKHIYSASDFRPLYEDYMKRPAHFRGLRVCFYRNVSESVFYRSAPRKMFSTL